MKIAVLGGSFDPIHNGHINIAKELHEKHNFEQVWLMPSASSAYSHKKISAPLLRLQLCNDVAKKHKFIKVCDLDIKRGGVTYTKDSVADLNKKFPKEDLTFIIGADTFKVFDKWEGFDEFFGKIKLGVVGRPGQSISKVKLEKLNTTNYPINKICMSSSAFRGANLINIPAETFIAIVKNGMYFKENIKNTLSPKRVEHSESVALTALNIAMKFKFNDLAIKSYIAGMWHDITKEIDKKTPTSHQLSGAKYVKDKLGCEDKDIISSIRRHATGAKRMGTLDKIIYIADISEPNRKPHDLITAVRRSTTFDEMFINAVIAKKHFLDEKGIVDEKQNEIFDHWIKKRA